MATDDLVYVGSYSEALDFGSGDVVHGRGIYRFRFDAVAGALSPAGLTEGVRNASYLTFDAQRRVLYCVHEIKDFEGKAQGAVSAFAIDPDTGDLTLLNMKASHGTDPCHLNVDATGRFLLVANYSSGSVCVLPIRADGSLDDASQVIQHEGSSINPQRQTGPHAHGVILASDNRFVLVPDLGQDKVMIYAFDAATGRLTPNPAQPFLATKPGAGPRQMAMHPAGGFAYLINELDSTMTACRYEAETGRLSALQTLPTLPDGFGGDSTCAGVRVAPSGTFLYGSNRGHDSIVIYAIDPATGKLSLVGHESTRGRMPRHFEISPTGAFLAAANQETNTVVMFRIDPESGKLTPTGNVVDAGTPICVRFMP